MASKKWWEEDETEKADKREQQQNDLFSLQDAAWETQLILDDCLSFALSLKKRMAHLHDLIDRREQELGRDSQELNDS